MSSLGIQLDRLMLSHRDADHTGGAASVLAAHPKADVWSSIEPSHPLALLRPITRCEAGQRWEWDGVRFEVLHPSSSDYVSAVSSNAISCVLRVDASQKLKPNLSHDRNPGSALFNGDIELAQEQALLVQAAIKPVDFFLVPHHGSQTSSSVAFVQTSQPRWAMVQAGYLNRYGHPAAKVVMRYQTLSVPLVQTANCGAAYWQSHQPDDLVCERTLARRYWHFVAK
jgi:competence protein ComEC